MSTVIMFYFTSSMFNMFRTLIHPSSGACDITNESSHWSCVLGSLCVGVSVWLSWGGIRVAGFSLQPLQTNHTKTPIHNEPRTTRPCGNSTTQSQAPDDGYINVRNMLST